MLLELAAELRESAADVLDTHGFKRGAARMLKAAKVLERMAPLDPDIEMIVGEN